MRCGHTGNLLVGLDYDLEEALSLVRQFARSKRAQAVYGAYLRLTQLVISVLSAGRSIPAALARNKAKVIATVCRLQTTLGLNRTLRLLGLTRHRYSRWRNQAEQPCIASLLSRCFQRYPGQLSTTEVATIKQVMRDERYHGWPAVSVYWHAVRRGLFGFARSTFYKYLRLLDLAPRRGESRRKDSATGIRALASNELWHADVTVFRTEDRLKSCIYFVVDNYSRKILSWAVDATCNAKTHIKTVREAQANVPASTESTELIPTVMTDGGSENGPDEEISLPYLTAQRDIRFSNSIVESVNKTVKYQSLYLANIPNMEAFKEHLARWVRMYNDERPHCAHGYLTPSEVYEGAIVESRRFAERFEAARKARIVLSRRTSCPVCEGHP